MTNASTEASLLDQAFLNARTYTAWQSIPVKDELLQQLYDVAKYGPTASNLSPLRVLYIKTPEAKERLKPCLAGGNIEKSMTAPVTAILATDTKFYQKWEILSPHKNWAEVFEKMSPEEVAVVGLRNSSLQAAYFMIVARILGLDCGPMSGFDNTKVDAEFFSGTTYQSNFLCNLGYGDPSKLYPRAGRLSFEQACQII